MTDTGHGESSNLRFPHGIRPVFGEASIGQLENEFNDAARRHIAQFVLNTVTREIDVVKTAERFDVLLERGHLKEGGDGRLVGGEKFKVLFRDDLPVEHEPFVFGHEMAHRQILLSRLYAGTLKQFYERIRNDQQYHDHVEEVCDFFSAKANNYIA